MRSNLINTLIDTLQEENTDFAEDIIEETIQEFQRHISKLNGKDAAKILLSTQNYIQRSTLKIHETFEVHVGDVCYIDFVIFSQINIYNISILSRSNAT